MSAAPATGTADAREAIDANYPGSLALLLTPLCRPVAGHTHSRLDEESGTWVQVVCEHPGKKPQGLGWNKAATARYANGVDRETHVASILEHLGSGGNVGLTIPPGALVLDCDNDDAVQWIANAIPDAPIQRTRSGAHFVVRQPRGVEIKAEVKVEVVAGIKVDLRVAGRSQIVVEPSMHLSGTFYSWTTALPLDLRELPECPPLIVESIKAQVRRTADGKDVNIDAAVYEDGTRNDSLFRLGCRLRRNGLVQTEILKALRAVNEERCRPSLDDAQVFEIVASCMRYPEGEQAAALFDKDLGFMPSKMGARLLEECRVVVGEGGQLYRYQAGVYRSDAQSWIASRVREILGERFKRRHRDETLAWFSSAIAVDSATPPIDLLNVRNGLLSWDGSTLKPHTPDFVSTVQIPVDWNPGARCDRFLAFLRDVLPDEPTVQFVLELIGYALFPRNMLHVAILLRGPGRNGKSVLLAVIQALLGEMNVAAVPLQQFAENRFAAASLVGKLANICGDLDARAITRTDLFKMLTGGDPIHTERKYQTAFAFRSFALPIFSANEPPQSADQSEAWFERWLVVPMDKTIKAEDRDPNLIAKLTTKVELEGLLVQAVNALARLRSRGRFEIPAAVQAARDDYRERLDSVSSFVANDLLFGPSGYVTRTDLAKAYRNHCRELDLHAVPTSRLYDRVRAADAGVAESKRHGTRGFMGVSVR